MIEALSHSHPPRLDSRSPRYAISTRVMPAKDGQYAPGLFREITNGTALIRMFLRSKIRCVSTIPPLAHVRPRRRFSELS
jgi:hypothetical protein